MQKKLLKTKILHSITILLTAKATSPAATGTEFSFTTQKYQSLLGNWHLRRNTLVLEEQQEDKDEELNAKIVVEQEWEYIFSWLWEGQTLHQLVSSCWYYKKHIVQT